MSTPIGNLGDFSKRGVEILNQVDRVLCEDTRVTAKLLDKIGIRKKLFIYNDHNAVSEIPHIIYEMKNGVVFAQVSDAGTPLISDPGYKLVRACIENNIKYTAVPGACAVINALVLSGFPSNKFFFAGFVEHSKLNTLKNIDATVILYEAPTKLLATLKEISEFFNDRCIAVIREMTKIYEEIVRGTAVEVIDHFCKNTPRGEFVIVIEPPHKRSNSELEQYNELIQMMLPTVSVNEISKILSKLSGLSKNVVYNHIRNIVQD